MSTQDARANDAAARSLSPGAARRMRLQSLQDGVLRLGPETVHIDVTNTCNTDCVTCWDHSPHLHVARSSAWKRQRVDAAAIATLLDDIESTGGLRAVIVSGMGEPFTHPEIYTMLGDMKRRGLHVTVITNLVAADVDLLPGLVDALLVGVQGASEASYDAFHPSFAGVKKWERLQAQLVRVRAAGIVQKHVQVVCNTNAHELVEMVELAAVHGADIVNFKLASLYGGTEVARISAAQREALWTALPKAQERAAALGVPTNLDVFARQLATGGAATAPIADVGCFLGTSYARITVDGTVLFCCNTEVVVGNLKDASFAALWHGGVWADWRAQMRRGAYLPSCSTCGKINQNEKLSARFKELFGEAAWRAQRGGDAAGAARAATQVHRARGLPVLP